MKTENQKQITAARAVAGSILSFFSLIAAQLITLLAGRTVGNAVSTVLETAAGITAGTAAESVAESITGSIVSSVLSAILYVAAALILANLISKKILKTTLPGCRITFRGIIMTALEKRWNKGIAVLVPSVIFALSHVIGADLDLPSILHLLIAGSLTGILFSLVTMESRSIWNSTLMHAVWNILLVGGIFYIGTEKSDLYIFNYVLDSRDFLVTGGDFGVEASVFAVIGYGIFILAAVLMMRGRKKGKMRIRKRSRNQNRLYEAD